MYLKVLPFGRAFFIYIIPITLLNLTKFEVMKIEKLKNNDKWLFKYMPFNLNMLKVLINNQLWFGKPDLQNDPNEFRFSIRLNDELTSYESAFQFTPPEQLLKDFYNVHPEDIDKIELQNNIQETVKAWIGICSFSWVRDDILMWAHYANSNNGVCLVFNADLLIKDLSDNKNKLFHDNISYSKYSPRMDMKYDRNQNLLKFYGKSDPMLTKLDLWKYEHEYRFYKTHSRNNNNDKFRNQPFNPHCLEGVIFGEKMETKNIETLNNLIQNTKKLNHIKFWKAHKPNRVNRMQIRPFKPS